MPAATLPAESLAHSLLLAARAVAAVRAGKSLGDAAEAWRGESPAARAAAQEISYGTLRRHGWSDFILARLMQRPPQPEIQALLGAALHRLETRPDAPHTVVDQAVAAAGQIAAGAFRGLVNGVLRNYLRQREALLEAATTDPVATHWHPAWWLERLKRAYPGSWQEIVAADNRQGPMTLRVNQRRGTRDDYQAQLAAAGIAARPVGPAALLLERPVPVEALPGFADGLASVQDAGAQLAAPLLDLADGLRVLDACAAPGGKTAHMLELAAADVTALDADATRVRLVEQNLARLGLGATTRAADARQPAEWWDGRPFDRILADVPCSASGVVRRHPDAKWLRRDADIRRFAAVQSEILEALWPLLQPGGRLVYVTCSLFPEENGRQIDAFLSRHADASPVPIDGQRDLQLIPDNDHDGFYYAALAKLA